MAIIVTLLGVSMILLVVGVALINQRRRAAAASRPSVPASQDSRTFANPLFRSTPENNYGVINEPDVLILKNSRQSVTNGEEDA